jgi:hypothetical protein
VKSKLTKRTAIFFLDLFAFFFKLFVNYFVFVLSYRENFANTNSVYGEVMYIFTFRFDNILKEMHIILTLAVHSFDRKINQDKLLGLLYKYSE